MKTIQSLIVSVLLATPVSGWTQLTINPGDVFTFPFSSMQFQYASNSLNPNIRSLATLEFDTSALQLADDVRFEMFANSTNDAPFFTRLLSDPLYIPHRQAGGGPILLSSIFGPWGDFQGVVRFTGLAGTVGIDNIKVGQAIDGFTVDFAFTQYGASIAIPEPATISLAVCSALAVAGWHFSHRRRERR